MMAINFKGKSPGGARSGYRSAAGRPFAVERLEQRRVLASELGVLHHTQLEADTVSLAAPDLASPAPLPPAESGLALDYERLSGWQATGPSGPYSACEWSASSPYDGTGCDPHTFAGGRSVLESWTVAVESSGDTTAGQPGSGPLAFAEGEFEQSSPTASGANQEPLSASGPTGSGPTGSGPSGSGPSGSGPTGSGPTGSGPTGSGPTGSGPSACGPAFVTAGRSADQAATANAVDDWQFLTVPEGVEVEIDTAAWSSLPGTTPYAPLSSVEQWSAQPPGSPWVPGAGELEFGVAANGTMADHAPHRLLLSRLDSLKVDGQAYTHLGTWQRRDPAGDLYWPHVSYHAVFVLDQRFYALVTVDISGGGDLGCGVVLPRSIVAWAEWFDVQDYQFRIDWGDGHSGEGQLQLATDGGWFVRGSHTYEWNALEHPYQTSTSIYSRTLHGWQLRRQQLDRVEVNVTDALHWIAVGAHEVDLEGYLPLEATLFDHDPLHASYTYEILIDWGDGSTSPGELFPGAGGAGQYTIRGWHAYQTRGWFAGSIQATASDGSRFTATFDAYVENLRPGAEPGQYTLVHDRPFSANLLYGGSGNTARTVTLETTTAHGTLDLRSDGTFNYRSNSGFTGRDGFSYRIVENGISSWPINVSLEVINNPPQAHDDNWYVSHDRRFSQRVTSNDSDANADPLTARLQSQPQHGSLTLENDGRFTYFPAPGFLGVDWFTYDVSDGLATSPPATVVLHVGNRLPTLPAAQAFSVIHDRPLPGTWPAVDPDGDTLSVALRSRPQHGQVSFADDGTWTYTPRERYVGSDEFVFTIYDGFAESEPSVVSIEVTNRVPQAEGDSFAGSHDRPLRGPLPGVLGNDSDPDGDPLRATLLESTRHGQLVLELDGSFTYVPQPLFVGQDSFRYVLSDGIVDSEPVLVRLDVRHHPPQATELEVTDWPHDRTWISDLRQHVVDADADELWFELLAPPAVGSLVLQPQGQIAYSPPPGYTGEVEFSYRVSDSLAGSDQATVRLQVVQRPPSAPVSIHQRVAHDRVFQGNLITAVHDADVGEVLSVQLITSPTHGTLQLNSDGNFAYRPAPGFVSQNASQWDRFTFRASDGRSTTAEIEYTLEVFNWRPVANPDAYFIAHHQRLAAVLGRSGASSTNPDGWLQQAAPRVNDYDWDGDPLISYLLIDPATGSEMSVDDLGLEGQLTWPGDGTFQFDPGPRAAREVSFTYVASDGFTHSLPATVRIHVADTPPLAQNDVYTIVHHLALAATAGSAYLPLPAQQAASLLANDINAEGDPLVVSLVDPHTGTEIDAHDPQIPGQLQWNGDGTFIYQPSPGFEGEVQLGYRLSDGMFTSDVARLTIHVTRPGPQTADDVYRTWHDVPLSGNVSGNDTAVGSGLLFELLNAAGQVVQPEALSLLGDLTWAGDGSFTYQPPANWSGREEFQYRVFDGFDTSPPSRVRIEVENSLPQPSDIVHRVPPGSHYSATVASRNFRPPLLHGLSDREGDTLQIALVSNVRHGQLQIAPSGEFEYRPADGFQGVDGFTYRIHDGLGASELGYVIFNVINRPVEPQDDWYQAYLGIPLTGNVAYNDIELDGDPITVSWLDANTLEPISEADVLRYGRMTWNAYGGFEFTATATVPGGVRLAYTATDGWDDGGIAYVTLDVGRPVSPNTPPQAGNDRLSVAPGRELALSTMANWDGNSQRRPLEANDRDADGDLLTYELLVPPATGELTLHADGSLVYRPADSPGGPETFQYRVFDGVHFSNVATVTLNIVNQPPVAVSQALSVPHGQELTGDLKRLQAMRDDDGDPLAVVLSQPPQHGLLELAADGTFRYQPNAGFVGQDQFQFRVSDGSVTSPPATVLLSVVNHAPQALPLTLTLTHDSELLATLPLHSSLDADPVTARLAGGPFYGELTLSEDGRFRYTPPANFVGQDTFTYYWQDLSPSGGTGQGLAGGFATVTLQVMARAPRSLGDRFEVGYGETQYTLDVLANDTDPDGHGLTVRHVTTPEHGTVTIGTDGRLLYVPRDSEFQGPDRFFYQAESGGHLGLLTEVEVVVTPLRLVAAAVSPQGAERQVGLWHVADLSTLLDGTRATDFQVDIRWGDGQRSIGTLVPLGDTYQVLGTHAYAVQGNYTARVTLTHAAGHRVIIAAPIEVLNLSPQIATLPMQAIKGLPFQATLARLSDDADIAAEDYTARIDWGDGQQSEGVIRRVAAGELEIIQGHMYNHRGTYPVHIEVHQADGTVHLLSTTATVSHVVEVAGLASPLHGSQVSGLVGRFTSNSPAAQANQFVAMVNWGDGTSSPGMIVGQNGQFEVYGQHRYATPATYPITLEVTEDDPSQSVVQAADELNEPSGTIQIWGRNLELTGDQLLDSDVILAEFVDSDDATQAADYTIDITWGDGQNSTGSVQGSDGSFQISGQHRYARPGAYLIAFQITDADGLVTEGTSSLVVAAAPLVGSGHDVLRRGPRELVASFTDPAAGRDYQGRIRLGPGHYLPVNVDTVPMLRVETLADGQSPGPSTASPYERQRLEINNAPQSGSFTLALDGETTSNLPHDATAADIAAALDALSNVDAVLVNGNQGEFVIEFRGAHAYQDLPQLTIAGSTLSGGQNAWEVWADTRRLPAGELEVQIYQAGSHRLALMSRFAPPAPSADDLTAHPPPQLPDPSPDAVPELQLVEAEGLTITATSGAEFDGAIARLVGDASGWEAEINWGDGHVGPALIQDGEVRGSHTYRRPGAYRIAIALYKHDPAGTGRFDPWYYNTFELDYTYWWTVNNDWAYEPWWYNQLRWSWSGNSGFWQQGEYWVGGVVSGATVQAPTLDVTPAPRTTVAADQSLASFQLLSSNASDNAVAVIEWGDGRWSTGTIDQGAVSGEHVYQKPGFYTARITLRDGGQVAVVESEIDVTPLPQWPDWIAALDPGQLRGIENRELRDVAVAKVRLDAPRRIGGLHQATIDWGDGNRSAGLIRGVGSGNQLVILGSHTYTEAGAYDVAVTILEQAVTVEIHLTAIIDAEALAVTATSFPAAVGMPLDDIIVGRVQLAAADLPLANNYSARVDWGDGAVSAARLVAMGDEVLVVASHRYRQAGMYHTSVWVEDGPVVTRSGRASAPIQVAHAYAGGPPVDLFQGMLGGRDIPFDTLAAVQDVVQTNYTYSRQWDADGILQTWGSYSGWGELAEQISWGDGNSNRLSRHVPYWTLTSQGSLGRVEAWQWGLNSYLGWNEQQTQASGWWASTGKLTDALGYAYGIHWYLPSWPYLGSSYVPWLGGYGWGGWSWYATGLNHTLGGVDYPLFFHQPSTDWLNLHLWPSQGSGSQVSPNGDWQLHWAYEVHDDSATYDSTALWQWDDQTDYAASWHANYRRLALPHATNSSQHVFESAGDFDVTTTFGLTRQFRVVGASLEAPQTRPVIVGEAGVALPTTTLASFMKSDWGTSHDGLFFEIDWGDGAATTTGQLHQLPGGRLAIRASHTYAKPGDYEINIAVRGRDGLSRLFHSQAQIADRSLAATAHDVFAVAGETSGQMKVATLEAFRGDIHQITATVDWGDGPPPHPDNDLLPKEHLSSGEIRWNPQTQRYEIWGQHAYADIATAVQYYPLRVQIANSPHQPLVIESQVRVSHHWTASAQARHQGFGEAHSQTVAGIDVSLGTGQWQLQHELDFDLSPGTRVGGDPQLVFNSATSDPRPIIQAVVTGRAGTLPPSHLEARLLWPAQPPTPWTTFAIDSQQTTREYLIAVQSPTVVRQTGVYPWTIEIRIHTGLAEPLTISESGQSVVVVQNSIDDDPADPFDRLAPLGGGWHLSTVDQLVVTASGDVIYVNGLGYPRLFRKPPSVGDTAYVLNGPANEFGSLHFDPQQLAFVYTAPNQVKKHFNAWGLMQRVERPGLPPELYRYDAHGQLVSIQSLDAAVTSFTYAGGAATTIVQPGGRAVQLAYSGGALVQIREATGDRRFEYLHGQLIASHWGLLSNRITYDAHGRVSQVIPGGGAAYGFFPAATQGLQAVAQPAAADMARFVDPLGRRHDYGVDEAGRLLSYTGPGGGGDQIAATEVWQRDERFQIIAHTGPLGTATFAYDDRGNLVLHHAVDQGTTRFSYDSFFQQPLAVTDPSGFTTQYQLDNVSGQVIQSTNAAGGVEYRSYTGGLLMSTLALNGAATSYQYDAQRRLVAELGPQGRHRFQTYDAAGNLRSFQDATGATTSFVFDARNRLLSQTDAVGNTTHYTYDASGLLVAKVDPNGRRTRYTYDRRGFQIAISEGVGTILERTFLTVYDAVGNPIEEHDPQGFVTQHSYDARNRRTRTLDPGGGLTQYTYDAADQMIARVDRAGRNWAYHYDGLGRQIGVTDPGGRTAIRSLDWMGNVTAETDAAGRTTTHAYDGLYRRIATTFEDQLTQFEYDVAGNLIRTTDPLGRHTTYTYDLLHQPVARQDAAGEVWLTTYDQEGRAVATRDPLGRTTTTSYDLLGRPTDFLDAAGYRLQWAYDAMGNLAAVRDGRGYWTSSTFDLHNRRIVETDAYGHSQRFAYDLRDTLITTYDKLDRPTRYVPDALGQIVALQDPSGGVWQFTYDMAGNTVSQLDPLGRTTLNSFDELDRLVASRDAAGGETRLEYDAAGNVTRVLDALGYETRYAYDSLDRRLSATDALGATTTWQYDAVGNVLAEHRPQGSTTQHAYDALNRRISTIDALGGVSHFAYDAVGNLTSQTDALGYRQQFGYDALNRRTSVIDPLGQTSTSTYDANGNLLSSTDPLGRVSHTTYDRLNRVEMMTDPAGGVTRYEYDPIGNRLSVKNAAGESEGFAYDELDRLVARKSHALGTREYHYDAVGNLLMSLDGNGLSVTFGYDNLNRPVYREDGLGNRWQTTFDAVGNVIGSIDPLGNQTRWSYDALRRPVSTLDAQQHETQFAYDLRGNRTSLTDPSGNATTWTYDALDRMLSETDAAGSTRSYTYDAVGNRTRLSRADGRQIATSFDALRRPTLEQWSTEGQVVQTLMFAYDAAGQLLQASDGLSQLSWQYDALGNRRVETQRIGDLATARLVGSFDPLGRRLSLDTELNGELDSHLAMTLDRGGRVARIAQSGPEVAPKSISIRYDAGGRRTALDRFADIQRSQRVVHTAFEYDTADRLRQLTHAWDEGEQVSYALSWDAAHRLTALTSSTSGVTHYSYDTLGQLTQVAAAGRPPEHFEYDASGNRQAPETLVTDGNRLLSDGRETFVYDANGNLASRTRLATGEVVEYVYDHRDRLTDVRFRASAAGQLLRQVHYAYDPLDRRVLQQVDEDGDGDFERVEVSINDGWPGDRDGAGDAVLLRVDPEGKVLSRYLYGLAVDEVLAEERLDPATGEVAVEWLLADHQGSIREVLQYDALAADAALVEQVEYDAFGGLVDAGEAARDRSVGYTGRPWDAASQLQYNRRRYYDPSLGRFITPDPISFAAGDTNLYRYVGNHPPYATDPSGLDDVKELEQHRRILERRLELAYLARGAYTDEKLPDWVSENWWRKTLVNDSFKPRGTGINVVLFTNKSTKERVVAFSGTEAEFADIGTDLMNGIFGVSGQYHDALTVVRELIKRHGEDIVLVGHSLGGGLASAAAYYHGVTAYTFNPAGVHPVSIVGHQTAKTPRQLITAYVADGDPLNDMQAAVPILMPDVLGRVVRVTAVGKTGMEMHFMSSIIRGIELDLKRVNDRLIGSGTPMLESQ